MVRELVNGTSLSALLEKGARMSLALSAVAQAADLLTRLHRALMLHGDVKPANIIVGDDGAECPKTGARAWALAIIGRT